MLFAGTAAGQDAPPPAQPQDAAAPPTAADFAALRDEVKALREDLAAVQEEKSPSFLPGPPPRKPLGYEAFWPWVTPPDGLSLRGYIQSQYESHQDSQDQLNANGGLLNKDRFSIRRARLNLNGEWQYAAFSFELDGNTTNGPQLNLRKAEASLQYRPDRSKPPILMATMGLFDTPFGYEVPEASATRFFMERTQASTAFFPSEPDVGLRFAGALSFFRWTIAALNGNPMNEASGFGLQDPIKAKDVVFRFGIDAHPLPDLQVAADVSSLRGMGFHPGTTATSATLQYTDTNDNGQVEPYDLTGVPGSAATPSQNFQHWAVGFDGRVHFRTPLGVTKIYGEFVLAQNLDRGLYVADPVSTGVDQREMGYYVGAVQELTRWAVIGLRYDVYDPNLDSSDSRNGKLLPFSEAITTWSPMFGLVLPDRARLVFQYDAIRNAFGRSAIGVPANLQDNVFTGRLQVQL